MNVSLEQELRENARKERKAVTDPVKEVKLLLETSSSEDMRILRQLSPKSDLSRKDNIVSALIELENLEKKYAGEIFMIDQIEKLAIDYRLRFLQAKHFSGTFEATVAMKIREFAKSTNSPMDAHSLPNNYYILAPAQMFTLRSEKYVRPRVELDPVIFYQIDNKHYRMIHKWGNDFSIFRRLTGFRWKNFENYFAFNTALLYPFVVAALFMLVPTNLVIHGFWWLMLGAIVITSIVSFLFFRGFARVDDKRFFSTDNWRSETILVD